MHRGEIWHVDLNPIAGREIAGKRYVLLLSNADFTRVCGLSLVCPITIGGNLARDAGFAVPLTGAGTLAQGVAVANHVRTIDLKARGGRKVETAPDFIVEEVLAKLSAILD